MKVDIYFDVYPYTNSPEDISPTTHPWEKSKDATRYKVSVEIPDPRNPDVVLNGEIEKV